jgi:hypothetical protein
MSQTSDIRFSDYAQSKGAKLLNKTKGDRVICADIIVSRLQCYGNFSI